MESSSTTRAAADLENALRPMLDKVGLRYALHSTAQGFPYAGFRVEIEPGRPLNLTAMVRGRALDLRASGVLSLPRREDDLWRINDVNVEWGLGRIYYDEEQSAYHWPFPFSSVFVAKAASMCTSRWRRPNDFVETVRSPPWRKRFISFFLCRLLIYYFQSDDGFSVRFRYFHLF